MCALQVLLCSYRCQGGVLKQGSAILGGGLKSAQGAQFAPSFLSSRFDMVLWHLQVLFFVLHRLEAGSAVTAGRLVTEFLGGGFVGEIKLTSPGGLAWNFRPHADERDGWVRSPHTCFTREKFCSGESATPIGFISGG